MLRGGKCYTIQKLSEVPNWLNSISENMYVIFSVALEGSHPSVTLLLKAFLIQYKKTYTYRRQSQQDEVVESF